MPQPDKLAEAISEHYARENLAQRIFDGLAVQGKTQRNLTAADLAPVDQLHTGGRTAVYELVSLAQILPGSRVVDIGGGLGGPARILAGELRCQVTVLELTPEFAKVGALLSERLDLANRVHYVCADALSMPFEDAWFDAAWTQHSTMNISDKPALYRQLFRTLRRGGRLAMHEIVAGPVASPHYPTPWASAAAQSFLLPEEELRNTIERAGFRPLAWQNITTESREWFQRAAPPPLPADRVPGLAATLVVEPEALQAQTRNLLEDRVNVVRAVFERP
ncbi:MAG: methyltransferase domain-containing protein [Chloroflexi bacterium]|nr:methyltransferase domain-containing protein [Chloroflexota bacterium]